VVDYLRFLIPSISVIVSYHADPVDDCSIQHQKRQPHLCRGSSRVPSSFFLSPFAEKSIPLWFIQPRCFSSFLHVSFDPLSDGLELSMCSMRVVELRHLCRNCQSSGLKHASFDSMQREYEGIKVGLLLLLAFLFFFSSLLFSHVLYCSQLPDSWNTSLSSRVQLITN
jgi:hypothetical protein